MSSEKILAAVIDGLLDCLGFLELSDDDTVNPDDATRTMETVGGRLATLSTEDRLALAVLIRTRANNEPPSAWREFVEGTPAAFGLIDPSIAPEPAD